MFLKMNVPSFPLSTKTTPSPIPNSIPNAHNSYKGNTVSKWIRHVLSPACGEGGQSEVREKSPSYSSRGNYEKDVTGGSKANNTTRGVKRQKSKRGIMTCQRAGKKRPLVRNQSAPFRFFLGILPFCKGRGASCMLCVLSLAGNLVLSGS